MTLFGVFRGYVTLLRAFLGPFDPFGAFWGFFGVRLIGFRGIFGGHFGVFSIPLEHYLGDLGPCDPFWGILGPFDPFLGHLGVM